MKVSCPLWTLALLLAVLSHPASALPRVTAQLQELTLIGALRELQRQTGWEFLVGDRPVLDLPEDPQAARASFRWEGSSLGAACREIERAFNVSPEFAGPRRVAFKPAKPAAAPRHRLEREGYTFSVLRVRRETTARSTPARPAPHVTRTAHLLLAVRPHSGDPAALAGLEEVRLSTDQGPAAPFEPGELAYYPGMGRPDEWHCPVTLDRLRPGSREITRFSGVLVTRQLLCSELLKIPLDVRTPFQRELGPLSVQVSRLTVSGEQRVTVALDAEWPAPGELVGPDGEIPSLHLLLRSGRTLPFSGESDLSGSRRRGIRRLVLDQSVRYPRPDDPPVALLWEVILKGEVDRRIPFRLSNILLPPPAAAPVPGGALR